MPASVNIRDPDTSNAAKVSRNGELYTSPLHYSAVYQVSSSDINLHEVVAGRASEIFIIRTAIISQDKTNTDVDVTLTEADDEEGTNSVIIFTGGTTKSDRIIVPMLNVATGKAKWLNMQHDSSTATISITITGYYVDA